MRERERLIHTFDAAGYIADLAAAGVKAVNYKGSLFLYCGAGGSFGAAYSDVNLRYMSAMDADADWVARVMAIVPVHRDGNPL